MTTLTNNRIRGVFQANQIETKRPKDNQEQAQQQSVVYLSWYDTSTEAGEVKETTLPITIGRQPSQNSVVIPNQTISKTHLRLEKHPDGYEVIDLNSRNGILLNGERINRSAVVGANQLFQIGPVIMRLTHRKVKPYTKRPSQAPSLVQERKFPRAFRGQILPISQLPKHIATESTTFLAVGGGLGSFCWVDHLVVHGVAQENIRVIGFEEQPYGRYRQLCLNSQIPDHERLRSNSDSCPDNLWGWPGYAVREIWNDVTHGRLINATKVGWQILNEPFVQTYTPKAADVFDSVDREAQRIGWEGMFTKGRAYAIRKTDDGRYAVLYGRKEAGKPTEYRIMLANFIHLAVGYPGVKFLPDLQAYRQKTGDLHRVVNAYEAHDHVYQSLGQTGGVVIIRGRGIVASRIIQRLLEVRLESGADIRVLHLMRSPKVEGNRYQRSQRDVDNHWEFQPFNWPKAAWGGELRNVLEAGNKEDRKALLTSWGGTTTADREDWREMIEDGLRNGWYEIAFGNVTEVKATNDVTLNLIIQNEATINRHINLSANYIIDATGLETDIERNHLLKDLCQTYDLDRNSQNRLAVTENFELTMMRNGTGRIFASGISTLGGPYAPVDSFLGLQYAAQKSIEALLSERARQLEPLAGFKSLKQWVRWARGVQP